MARNLLDDYMNQPKRQGNKNLLDEYIKMSTPKLDTTAYTNMLNTLLNSSAVTGNGYQTPVVMASAANTARKAQQIAEKYGIGDSSYRQYLDSVASGVQGKQEFMSQFTGKQDYNERYAYPQTVKGKTDVEIEAMIGAVPKAQNLLNRAAAFGKGTGSSGDDAYQKWLTDYFNNQTVTGLDRQIADNQGLLNANKAKQEGLLASAYVPENVGMTAADRKIREDYIAQYPNQERQEMEWTEMATGLAGWEEQKQIIEEMIKELQESGSFDQAKMDELQDSWLDAERHIHNLEEQMDAYTAPDEAERLAGQETHTYVGATPEQERLDALYYQYLDELDKDNKLKYETGPEQWAYDRDMQLYGLTSEQEKLDAQIAVLNAKREGVVARSKYNELASAPDFTAKSAYDSDNGDRLYQYINAKGTSQEQGAAPVFGMGEFAGAVDVSAANDEASYQAAGYTFLLPDEVQAYNYIYATEGQKEAKTFLDSFQNIRNLRARSKESEEWAKYADEHGVWASVVSLGTNLAAGLVYPIQLADAAFNPNHSQFSDLYTANYATQAIRGTVGQNVAEWAGHDLGNTVYQTLMSLGDFGVALAAGKGAGALAGSGFARGMTQFIMSSEAGSSALLNNLQRGLSTDKAVGMSVASAMIEALTEKYSIDALLKEPKKAALYIAKNMLTEGSEEAASNLANTLVDLIVNADQAELAQAIAEKGYAQALTEYAQSVGMDAIMGALSGGIMGGGSVAVNKGVQAYHTAQTGKQINTNQTYKQLHDIAVAMPEGSKARKIAQGNDKLNNRKAGQLYNALMEELDAKSQTSVRKSMVTDIKGRLQELGAQGDTTQVAEAIQKAWMGEKLSARESDLIAQNKLAMQVQRELLDLEAGWADKAQEAASKQRREALNQMLDVDRLASKGYVPAQDDAASKAIAKNASTTYANADQEKGLNTTAYTKEGTAVEIKRIEEQDGKAVYLVEKDGQDVTYAINDLELDSINTENLVQPLKQGKMSVKAANTMMQLYATSGLSAPLYVKGFTVAYNAGVQRIGMAYVNNNSYSKALSPEVRKAAFDAGMSDTKDEAPSVTKRKGRVTVDKSIDKANLTDNQKASIRAMEKLAKALHIDIEFFASKADATGSYAAYENGSFRDGVMRLDINAGRDKSTDVTEFAILRTASHELTHYIAEASPQMYRELQAFVVDHLLEKGQNLQTLMDRKKARENRAMSDEAALEEVIADACEMMLKDSTAIETLARENATLFEKMADWLRDFFDKIREAFAGVEAVHAEARTLMVEGPDGVMHYIDSLQALWDKALVDAAHNVSAVSDVGAVYKGEKFSAREADAAYNQAIDRGDIPAAQKLVDEAARRAGYTVKAYHGTGADFTIFSEDKVSGRNVWGKGFYFGTSKAIADDYATYRAENGGRYRVVDALLKMKNPFIPNKSSLGTAEEILDRWFPDMWRGNARDLGIGYIEGKLNRSPLDLLQFIAEHNGIEIRDVLTEYGYDSIKDGGELVVFNANQIKSAEPVTFGDNNRVIPLSERFNEEKDDIRYARRDLFTPAEYGRLKQLKSTDHYENRPNGGKLIYMDNLLLYTHPSGDIEYVLEVVHEEVPEFVWDVTEIQTIMAQYEQEGVTHETQRELLPSVAGERCARFRTPGKGKDFRRKDGTGTGRAEGRLGKRVRGNVSQAKNERQVTTRRSIFFPSRFNRLFDQYLSKMQTPQYNPANFRPGEFTTMRIGDDVLLLKRRTENEFGLSAHFGANLDSRLTNARFENKRFASRADALAWLNGLKNENGKPLLFKSNWEPTSKKMFSVREPVERAKDMIAMHNIGGDAMMQFIKNGRLYWPSVAIVNDKAKFDSFGEYSLLFAPWQFGEDWDDPESAPLTERFRMYGSDAYTPSLPQEVASALQKGEDTFRSMYGEWGTDPASVDDYIETMYGSRFNHGFPGSVRANAAKRYSSIEAMKKDRDRLMRDGAIYDTMTISKDLDERRNDLILRIWDKNGGSYGSYSNFRYEKYAGFENDLLLTVLDTVKDGKYMEEYGQQLEVIIDFAKERGIKMDRQLAKELLQLFEAVANDMVGYFEIKFSRNVNGAMDSGYPQVIVAPDNLPDAVRKYAEEAGIGLYTYKAGDSNNRRDVVNEAAGLEGMKFQARDADTISPREALANALETAAKNDLERGLLADYKKIIQSLNEDQEKLAGHQKIIRELSFKKGGLSQQEKDALAMAKNRAEIVRNRLNRNDKKLLNLEATEALKAVVARERVVAERKIREEKDKQLAAYRERTRDTLTRSALRDRIRHDVKALNRLLLNETDTKHVPEELKGAVAQFLTVFTQDSSVFGKRETGEAVDENGAVFTKTILDDLRAAYGKISDRASDENRDMPQLASLYDGDIAIMLDELRDTIGERRLSELDQLETESVYNIVKHFKHLIQKANNVFVEGRSQQISALGDEIIKAADEQKQYAGKDDPVRTMLTKGMITPSYFFKKMGGSMKKLFDDLKAGESMWGLREAEARKFFNETAKKYNYWDWAEKREGMKPELLKIETSEGKTITLTREQAMSLYATWNRETSDNGQSARHLAEGGFVYEDAMEQDKISKKVTSINTKNPFKITKDDMAKVEAWLTDEQKGYVREMVRYMSEDMAKLGNEVSMQLFGYEKYTEKNYFPYQSSKNWLYTAPGQRTATNDQRLKHASHTHKLTNFANNPIILSDFTTVWSGHVNHMILYSSMCVPLENLNRVYNYKYSEMVPAFNEKGEPEIDKNTGEQKMVARGTQHSVKNSLENAYGRKALEYIDQLMVDMNGGVRVKDDGIMNRLSSVFKKNAVMLSASVVVQQPSAMVRAMALVDPKYFAKGVAMHSSWDELKQYSGLAVIKEMGGFDTGVGESTQNWLVHREINRNSSLDAIGKELVKKDSVLRSEVMGFLPAKADELTWTHIWRAVKAETRDRTDLAVNSEAFLREAARRFDEVISYTQVYDSTLSKSQMMRNKSLNMVTAFMAEPTVTYNLLVDAFTNRGKADSVKIPRAVGAFVATTLVNAMLKSIVYAARDDDEEKGFWDKYFREFTESAVLDLTFVNSIPYARDIVSLIQGYDVERPDMSVISDVVDNLKNIFDDDLTGEQRAKEIAILAGNITGVPVKNVIRDVNAMLNVWNMRGTLDEAPEYTGRTFLESLTFWSRESASTYYGYIVDEMEKGNTSGANELWEYTAAVYGKTDKAIKSGAKTQLGKRYKAGKIGDAEATDILMDYFEMDADEAYWQLKEWREKEAHKDEDDYSFSRTDDLKEALLSGKTAQIEAAKTELAGVGGYTDKEVVSKAKIAIKSLYVDGQITFDKAVEMLNEQTDEYLNEEKGSKKRERQKKIENDLYWLEQEWEYAKANKDNDDADTWNKYNDMHATIESGKGQREAVKYLMDHGVTKSGIKSSIDSRWAERYKKLYQTDRRAAIQLQSQIIDALVAAGYNRGDMAAHIRKNWLK